MCSEKEMEDQQNNNEVEEPPSSDEPPPPWQNTPPSKWNDWHWQLSNRLGTPDDFARTIRLSPEETEGLSAPDCFRVDVTPYFASLMDPHDPNCPIRRQLIPTNRETLPFEAEMVDSLSEEAHSPVPGLVHRYPDRVLMLVTTQCASYCRFCTRSRLVGDAHTQFNSAQHQAQLDYIAATPQIRDVLLSGGDPLTLPDRVLRGLLQRLRAIPHVEIIRIGTRVPVFLPQRITTELVAMLRQYHPLWMNIHFNHPKEIAPEVEAALARLADAGIPLGSQTVLMAGINDCPNIMRALVHRLVENRVRPYYIYQCDLVHGAGHFRTPVAKGIEIMEALRGHTSGYAIPTFVIDAPEGGGKVPILPNYLLSMSESRVVVRNFEGLVSTYVQPTDYPSHDPAVCVHCLARHSEGGQEGVAGLLSASARTIAPEGWHNLHHRELHPVALPATLPRSRNGGNGRTCPPRKAAPAIIKTEQGLLAKEGQPESRTTPPPNVRKKTDRGWRVGLVYNLKRDMQVNPEGPLDANAEYDSMETVEALRDALCAGGHQVIMLEGDQTLLDTVRESRPDICFNISEGLQGDARESHVPALLQMLSIPYTGSTVLGHAISLDKSTTKRVWRDAGLPTASFQVFRSGEESLDPGLDFPLFVKPLHEGTGMGINGQSLVHNDAELRQQARWVTKTYRQPALVESYLPGREFTVGLIGNTVQPGEPPRCGLYDRQGFHLFPVLEIEATVGEGQGFYNTVAKSYLPGEKGAPLYFCPADIPGDLEHKLKQLAVKAFEAIGALDLSRVDFRLGSDGQPYLLEVNTLPGLNPASSDLCIMSRAEGMHYAELINEIINLAAARYGLRTQSSRSVTKKQKHRRSVVQSRPSAVMTPLQMGGAR